jgi:hypothetical protein
VGSGEPGVTDTPAWPKSFDSALQAFLAFNDYIHANGAGYYGTVVPDSLGLVETASGSFIGTSYYSNGTTLGISLGSVSNGTQVLMKVGFELHNSSGLEVARTDWYVNAQRDYDKTPHLHFWDDRQRFPLENWPQLRSLVCSYFGVTNLPSDGS